MRRASGGRGSPPPPAACSPWRWSPAPTCICIRRGEDLAGAVVAHIQNPDEAGAIAPDQTLNPMTPATWRTSSTAPAYACRAAWADVSYAHVCLFRGERVVHLVVQGRDGPVTILLLPHIHVSRNMPVDEGDFHGVIVPAGQGSIAIVTNNATPVEPMEQELAANVQWTL